MYFIRAECIISMLLDENPLVELSDEDGTNLVRLLVHMSKGLSERE